jgi:hypothetical protein
MWARSCTDDNSFSALQLQGEYEVIITKSSSPTTRRLAEFLLCAASIASRSIINITMSVLLVRLAIVTALFASGPVAVGAVVAATAAASERETNHPAEVGAAGKDPGACPSSLLSLSLPRSPGVSHILSSERHC